MEDLASLVEPATLLLELGPLDPYARVGADGDPALVDGARAVVLLVALLKLDVRLPGLVVRFPLHPAFEDLARTRHILEELLEVHVLVPQLIDPGEERDRAVEEVPRVLDVSAL